MALDRGSFSEGGCIALPAGTSPPRATVMVDAGHGGPDPGSLGTTADGRTVTAVSIAVMEIVDNAVMVGVPGAMDAGLTSGLFWGALAFSLLVAFVLTTPINRWLIGRGQGYAVVHAYHHAH